MGARGSARTHGWCTCGHHFRPLPPRTWGLPKPLAHALDRTTAVRRVGTTAAFTGVGIQQAITENA